MSARSVFVVVVVALCCLSVHAQEVAYAVRVGDGAALDWDGKSAYKVTIPKLGQLEVVEESRDEKSSLSAALYFLTGVKSMTSNGQMVQEPQYGTVMRNRCAIAVGETCVAQDANGKAIYTIIRTR